MIQRAKENPVIRTADIPASRDDFEVIGAFNAGVAMLGNETLLLIRVAERVIPRDGETACPVYSEEKGGVTVARFSKDQVEDASDPRSFTVNGKRYLTSISHFRVARSKDGFHFTADPQPLMMPANSYEAFGIEDARISQINEHFYITYSAASPRGCTVSLAETDDFKTVRRLGIAFPPDNKDTVLFDRKIGSRYYALHRPSASGFARPEIWLAESPDGRCFGLHRFVAGVRPGKWDGGRVGAGAPPFLTDRGWVEIYHGATDDDRYCMGALLLDRDEPWKVLARSEEPLLQPELPYETDGFFGNVIFGCGLTRQGDTIRLYYGAADTSVAAASMTLEDVYRNLGLI